MKAVVFLNEAKKMVEEAIKRGTMVFIHEYNTTRFYGFKFETVNNNDTWATKITRYSYNLENGKVILTSKRDDKQDRLFDNLKNMLNSHENILSDTFDEMKLLIEDVWRQEKTKQQESFILGLFA